MPGRQAHGSANRATARDRAWWPARPGTIGGRICILAAGLLLGASQPAGTATIGIGEMIRLKGYATLVANGVPCNSACGLIRLAGSPRVLEGSASIGFRASDDRGPGSNRASGVGDAIVGRHLTLLNPPERAVIFATSAPPGGLNYLTAANPGASGIDAMIIDDAPDEDSGGGSRGAAEAAPATDEVAIAAWARVGPWTILTDPNLGGDCSMFSAGRGGTTFRIGVTPAREVKNYMTIENPAWASFTPGANYAIVLQFDDSEPWEALATAFLIDMEKFLVVQFDEVEVWNDLRRARSMLISYQGKAIDRLTMTQSNAAYREMQRCQFEQVKARAQLFAR